MLAFESIPFVRIGILTDVTAHLHAIAPARSLGKFPHTCKLDFEREHPSPTSHCCAGEAGDNYRRFSTRVFERDRSPKRSQRVKM